MFRRNQIKMVWKRCMQRGSRKRSNSTMCRHRTSSQFRSRNCKFANFSDQWTALNGNLCTSATGDPPAMAARPAETVPKRHVQDAVERHSMRPTLFEDFETESATESPDCLLNVWKTRSTKRCIVLDSVCLLTPLARRRLFNGRKKTAVEPTWQAAARSRIRNVRYLKPSALFELFISRRSRNSPVKLSNRKKT